MGTTRVKRLLRTTSLLAVLFAAGFPGLSPVALANDLSPSVEESPGERLARSIQFLEMRVHQDPEDNVSLNLLAERYLDRLRAGGTDADLTLARNAVKRSLDSVEAALNPDALALGVQIDHAAHRFDAARVGAERLVKAMPSEGMYQQLLGDALFELGRIADAQGAFEAAARLEGKQIHTESRFAQIALFNGDHSRAQQHLQEAIRLATSHPSADTELIAWSHAQLGQYWFSRGRWQEAEAEYRHARKAAPGSLLVDGLFAELAAARGDYASAVSQFLDINRRSERPEFRQALGDVLVFAGKPEEAKQWHDQAVAGYMASVDAGFVHYYHHLAGFFTDSRPDGKLAVHWAQKDLELRDTLAAHDAYAWALYLDGQIDKAADHAEKIILSPSVDAHLLFHAGMIVSRHGDIPRGAQLLQRARNENPYLHSFHLHR